MRTNNYFLVLDIETSTETTYDNKLQKEVELTTVVFVFITIKVLSLQ